MYYSGIKHCDMVDGPGIRVTLFVSGCDRHCDECHNPETHDPCYGQPFNNIAYNEIIEDLKCEWCSGTTLCGGDPLYPGNRKDVATLVEHLKEDFPTKSIWMYTGYALDDILYLNDDSIDRILNNVDVILDGPYVKSLNSPDKHWVGSSNQHIYQIDHSDKLSFTRIDED